MALPPILTNLPFFKNFKAQAATDNTARPEKPSSGTSRTQDTVDVSSAARRTLGALQNLSADNQEQVRAVAAQTRALLAQGGETLGLDPRFS